MNDMQSMLEGRATLLAGFGTRLSGAVAKGFAAAVYLIILVAAVVAVVVLKGSIKWSLLGGVLGAGLVYGAYQFGATRSSNGRPNADIGPEGDLIHQIPLLDAQHMDNGFHSTWKYHDLSTEAAEAEYYRTLAESIRGAKAVVYRSGRGFTCETLNRFSRDLIDAEESALQEGVQIHRIQTSNHVSKEWAEHYARLVEKYPGRLFMYADFNDPALVNVGLIDPKGSRPEIQMLFESNTASGHSSHRANVAISVYGAPEFSWSLQLQFKNWISKLRILSAEQVRDLARTYLYFAYGSNMSPAQMRERCPEAMRIGNGVLYGWKRNFAVPAPHMGSKAAAAGIERSDRDNDYVEGIVYDLTAAEKRSLDEVEAGGYIPVEINLKLNGNHAAGYTHMPITQPAPSDFRPPHDYLQRIIDGAEMNGLEELAKKLRLSMNASR
jgi:gamma-glutamylcyclotransferase